MKPTSGKAFVVVLLCALSAGAQTQRGRVPAAGRIPTRTRLVSLYSDLERQLAAAAQNQDHARLDQLLDGDFEQWGPEPPGDPVSREDWKAGYHPTAFTLRQMSVRTFGDTDVASFVAHQKGTLGDKELNGEYFVTDVWRHEGNAFKLAARYVSRTAEIRVAPASPSGKR